VLCRLLQIFERRQQAQSLQLIKDRLVQKWLQWKRKSSVLSKVKKLFETLQNSGELKALSVLGQLNAMPDVTKRRVEQGKLVSL